MLMLVHHGGVLLELTLGAELDSFNVGSFLATFASAMRIKPNSLHVEASPHCCISKVFSASQCYISYRAALDPQNMPHVTCRGSAW